MKLLPFGFATSLALFMMSALIGALISYNTPLAWNRFAALALSVAVCLLFMVLPEEIRAFGRTNFPLLRVTLAVFPLAFMLYFVFVNDWQARLGKVAWLDPVWRWFATWQPRIPGPTLDANSFGGALAMLLPLQIAALWRKRQSMAQRVIAVTLSLVSLGGLIVSASRGAWIAFGLVAWIAVMWLVLAHVQPAWQYGRMRLVIGSGLVVYLAITIGIALGLTPIGTWLMREGSGHWAVARDSFDLMSDYPFTGIGLGAFTMAYSSYLLLVHVPHTIHAHNLFLDIWLEQGLLGLLAFAGLIVVGLLNLPGSRWRLAALASLSVMFIHGWLDDAFYGYGAGALALMLIPVGMLARELSTSAMRAPRWFAPTWAGVIVFIGLIVALVPMTRALWEANLGALAQTRAELAVYEWPRYAFQDQLRRNNVVNLNPAIASFERALALDPGNATAHRRLGQIALARGEYAQARQHFESAYVRAPQHRASRQLLGEVLAVEGDLDAAVKLWRTVDMSAGQLDVRRWWYEYLGDRERLKRVNQAAQMQKLE